MGERVGVALVSYGSREVAMADAFLRSRKYDVELYVADRLRNVYNARHAKEHAIIPSLDIHNITSFFAKHREEIDFGIVGPEDPIINGIRDEVEKETGIPIICPTKEFALEKSKVAQRLLLQNLLPEVNPRFQVFDPKDYQSENEVKVEVWKWLDEIGDKGVVKPDGSSRGKGVGVWGDHFQTRAELFDHFMSNFRFGPTIIEEKLEGEESSYIAFCDGQHLVRLPETRDNKRAFDRDSGPNTGGMGSYKNLGDWLPFMTIQDYEDEDRIVRTIFENMRGKTRNSCLLGVPFYVAMMHTASGVKVLEINSRPGDPEILNLLPILKDDFVDVCYSILEGTLNKVSFESKATVATYKVPPTYGGSVKEYSGDRRVDLSKAEELCSKLPGNLRLYPGSLELRDSGTYALNSRTVCSVGIGDSIEEARELSLEGLKGVRGDLWNRSDIASREQIQKSIDHMRLLRTSP